MPTRRTLAKLQKEVDNFNSKHKVGDKVKLKMDSGEVKEVTIRNEATILSGHSAVGWFGGVGIVSGCYSLDKVLV